MASTRVTLVIAHEHGKPACLHHHLFTNDARIAAAESSVMGRRGCAALVFCATLGGVDGTFRASEIYDANPKSLQRLRSYVALHALVEICTARE